MFSFRKQNAVACTLALSLSVFGGMSGLDAPAYAATVSTEKARLPQDVTPSSYNLYIEPNPDKGRFIGSETIKINVSKTTDEILLNAVEIKVLEAQCRESSAKAEPMKAKISYRPDSEQVCLSFPHQLAAGHYELSLKFDGFVNDKLHGLYRSSFEDKPGHKEWLAVTQMEAIDARRMFPCFDEPEFKATFSLTVSVAPGLVALSNSAVAEEKTEPKTERKIIRFEETPKMSTYLLALLVGPLVPSEARISEGVPIRVWSTPGHEKQTDFALDTASKLLPFFNSYFGVKYPAKKLDLIAIPDFSAGAMENLGAITFRETYLLIDAKEGSTEAKQDVAGTIAHEMAHMWFGDLVTMKWWDDLWLNEAFATWMSSKAVDFLRPDWHQWDNFGLARLRSMETDAMRSTRSIHFSVTDPTQVEQMFDEITYGKGASVLRMLEQYVSESVFRDGVQRYIKAHQFSNATTQDLWKSIGEASGKEINEMMHSWVYEPGFPLVSVDMGGNSLAVEQERFLVHKQKERTSFEALWQVPLAVRSLASKTVSAPSGSLFARADKPAAVKPAPNGGSDERVIRELLTEHDKKMMMPIVAPYLVNAGGDGYYRVRYNLPALREISRDLTKLSVLERGALLSDQFSLALAGEIPVPEYLTLTGQYKNEQDPNVMSIMTKELYALDTLIADQSRSAFASFVRDRLTAAKTRLGWNPGADDTDLTKVLRSDVLTAFGTIGEDKETIHEARELFNKLRANSDSVDPDLVEAVINIVAYNGDANDYANIEQIWHTAKSPQREKAALLALGTFRDPVLMQKTLTMVMTDKVRTQDGPNLISTLAESVAGRKLGWEFIQSHWKQMSERFTRHQLPHVIAAISSLTTAEELSEVKAFFKANPVAEASHRIAKTIEAIEINVAFRQRSGGALASWLASNTQNDKDTPHSSMR